MSTDQGVGRVGRWLAGLGLVDVVGLAGIAGGLVWLVMVHLLGMRHDAALILSVLTGVGAFARAHQLISRAHARGLDVSEVNDETP